MEDTGVWRDHFKTMLQILVAVCVCVTLLWAEQDKMQVSFTKPPFGPFTS